jgi:hypothetical protein
VMLRNDMVEHAVDLRLCVSGFLYSGVPAVLKFLKFKLCPEVVLKFRKFWIFS